MFTSNTRRIWCHGCRPEFEGDSDTYDWVYIPGRSMIAMSKDDFIILPGNSPELRTLWEFYCQVLGFTPEQAIWAPGDDYLLDSRIRKHMLPQLRAVVHGPGNYELVPYSVTKGFLSWQSSLNVPFLGDHPEFVFERGRKHILHRHIAHRRQPCIAELVGNIHTARGWVCDTLDDLIAAADELARHGITRTVIKPTAGLTGEGLVFVQSDDQILNYSFPMGPVILEEFLQIDRYPDGTEIAPAVHITGQQIDGAVTDQILYGSAFAGFALPSRLPENLQVVARETVQRLLRYLGTRGPGGFDAVCVNDTLHWIDVNLGRFNGSHPGKYWLSRFAPDSAAAAFKWIPNMSVWEFWDMLNEAGVAFVPGKTQSGIFPGCHLPGMWGQVLLVGDSRAQLDALKIAWQELCPAPAKEKLAS